MKHLRHARNSSLVSALTFTGLCVPFFMTSLPAQAEVIKIGISQQSAEQQSLPRPTTGMSMAQVQEQFGAPEQQSGPVGEPPISHWRYVAFSVYFEGDTVLHSVLHHKPKGEVAEPVTK